MAKKRKSKKWGPGNPLWEWKQKNKRSSKRTKKRVGTMVKRRKAYRRSKGRNLLSGKGMLGAKIGMGIIGTAAAGLFGAELAKRFMPGNQLASAGAGFLLGGPVGAATAYFMPNGITSLTGMLGGSTAATGSGIPIYG
jgi:hypothetical protein